jgi:hypothetical protein
MALPIVWTAQRIYPRTIAPHQESTSPTVQPILVADPAASEMVEESIALGIRGAVVAAMDVAAVAVAAAVVEVGAVAVVGVAVAEGRTMLISVFGLLLWGFSKRQCADAPEIECDWTRES